MGSMAGLALGDALGAHVEFKNRHFLLKYPVTDLRGGGTWGLRKGEFTDDTSMALCLASSLVAHHDFFPYDQLVRYKWWSKKGYMSSTGECFDIGASTKRALLEFEIRQFNFASSYNISVEQLDYLKPSEISKKFNVFCSDKNVAGNGALMRLAPVPLFFYRYPKYAVHFSGYNAKLTHDDQRAYDACRYYGALIVAALSGKSKKELLDDNFYSKHIDWFNNKPLHPDIMKVAQGSYKREHGYDQGIRGTGYVVNALEAALWAFYYDKDSFEIGVLAAINLGDDTDTTAAIYGQLAGAYYGYDRLPPRWLKYLYGHSFIKCLSKWIAYDAEKWNPNRPPPLTVSVAVNQQQRSNTTMDIYTTQQQYSNMNTWVSQLDLSQIDQTRSRRNDKSKFERVIQTNDDDEQSQSKKHTLNVTQPNGTNKPLTSQRSYGDTANSRPSRVVERNIRSNHLKPLQGSTSVAVSKGKSFIFD
ncbi:unnamed protein product [Rotaria sp. Silwood1]|nr:unnamed protein product [Rotaria sp. Silwood1]CAF4955490.1 unnamed protein product [Rotaria sp. Silwood1]